MSVADPHSLRRGGGIEGSTFFSDNVDFLGGADLEVEERVLLEEGSHLLQCQPYSEALSLQAIDIAVTDDCKGLDELLGRFLDRSRLRACGLLLI